nr:unnamed protein product [Callosobruchus chinensis]
MHAWICVLGKANISEQLDSAYLRQRIKQNEEVDKNCHILRRLIMCIKFCGAFELALRAHDETSTSDNPGIYTNGVQAIIKRTYPHAHFIHCYAHQFNLIIQRAAQCNESVKVFFLQICSHFQPFLPERQNERPFLVKQSNADYHELLAL